VAVIARLCNSARALAKSEPDLSSHPLVDCSGEPQENRLAFDGTTSGRRSPSRAVLLVSAVGDGEAILDCRTVCAAR